MFGVEADATTTEQLQDALGELASMTGGNLKALLPEPCRLSLPTVVEGHDYTLRILGSHLISQAARRLLSVLRRPQMACISVLPTR